MQAGRGHWGPRPAKFGERDKIGAGMSLFPAKPKLSAEFRRPQAAKQGLKPFFPGTCASEKTLLSPQACALCACDAAGCFPLSKMPAFLRSVANLFDMLSRTGTLGPLPGEVWRKRQNHALSRAARLMAERIPFRGARLMLWLMPTPNQSTPFSSWRWI